MIEDIALSPYYWFVVVVTVAFLSAGGKVGCFTYEFFCGLLIAQFLSHSVFVFGVLSEETIFLLLFCGIYWIFRTYAFGARSHNRDVTKKNVESVAIEFTWFRASALILIIFYVFKFALDPPRFGALLLDDRLRGQQSNRLIFGLGLAMPMFMASLIYKYVKYKNYLNKIDVVALVLSFIGLMTGGSKTLFIPIFIAIVSARHYVGFQQRLSMNAVFVILSIFSLFFFGLTFLFPDLSWFDIIKLVINRLVANTDSLEYLYVLHNAPSDYPWSGLNAMFPFLAKFLGVQIGDSAGAWLYGQRFGNFQGFGPNPGMLIDYFGNLSWFGLLFAAFLGSVMRFCKSRSNVMSFALLSFMSLAFSDFSMLFVSGTIWLIIFSSVLGWNALKTLSGRNVHRNFSGK
jgi:hypothetical protein